MIEENDIVALNHRFFFVFFFPIFFFSSNYPQVFQYISLTNITRHELRYSFFIQYQYSLFKMEQKTCMPKKVQQKYNNSGIIQT